MKWATGSSTPALSGISRCWGGRSGEAGAATPPTLVLEDQGGWIYCLPPALRAGATPAGRFFNHRRATGRCPEPDHHQQVIHKDLHPGNILFNPGTGLAQITDFGLASLLSANNPPCNRRRIEGVLAHLPGRPGG